MLVKIDENSGFCFGVVRAISEAEHALSSHKVVYCLGDVVHNQVEVQRLEKLGLQTISHNEIPQLEGNVMLIRAHGEPPSTYNLAKEYNVEVIDATCPVVAALQKKVIEAHEKLKETGGTVVILGKRGHAEVVGLTGQVRDRVLVIEQEKDLDNIDFTKPVYFLSQTTQSISLFYSLCEKMKERFKDKNLLTVDDTICRRVSKREENLTRFASEYEVIIFVCGKKSSNGKVLYDVCRKANTKSYNIEDIDELKPEWFTGVNSVGICGATSTPEWLMRKVADYISQNF